MKLLMKIRLRARKHWMITSLLIVFFVYALIRLALHFIKTSSGFDPEVFETQEDALIILGAVVIGLLGGFMLKKPKKTEDRDRPQEPTRHK